MERMGAKKLQRVVRGAQTFKNWTCITTKGVPLHQVISLDYE